MKVEALGLVGHVALGSTFSANHSVLAQLVGGSCPSTRVRNASEKLIWTPSCQQKSQILRRNEIRWSGGILLSSSPSVQCLTWWTSMNICAEEGRLSATTKTYGSCWFCWVDRLSVSKTDRTPDDAYVSGVREMFVSGLRAAISYGLRNGVKSSRCISELQVVLLILIFWCLGSLCLSCRLKHSLILSHHVSSSRLACSSQEQLQFR